MSHIQHEFQVEIVWQFSYFRTMAFCKRCIYLRKDFEHFCHPISLSNWMPVSTRFSSRSVTKLRLPNTTAIHLVLRRPGCVEDGCKSHKHQRKNVDYHAIVSDHYQYSLSLWLLLFRILAWSLLVLLLLLLLVLSYFVVSIIIICCCHYHY